MGEMTELALEVLDELRSYITSERSADGFPNDTALEAGESVELAASTFTNDRAVYIWEVISLKDPTRFVGSEHSDGGVTVFCDGPWSSMGEAQSFYGDCPEGWS
jgi:hypothetical protein|tara:strand:- start:8259 stop:8570 length:312 start_codon:yes stop_codon:yes gene_type:complete